MRIKVLPRKIAFTIDAFNELLTECYTEDLEKKLPMPIYISSEGLLDRYGNFSLDYNAAAMFVKRNWNTSFIFTDELFSLDLKYADEIGKLKALDKIDPDNFLIVVTKLTDYVQLNTVYGSDDIITPIELRQRYDIPCKRYE